MPLSVTSGTSHHKDTILMGGKGPSDVLRIRRPTARQNTLMGLRGPSGVSEGANTHSVQINTAPLAVSMYPFGCTVVYCIRTVLLCLLAQPAGERATKKG